METNTSFVNSNKSAPMDELSEYIKQKEQWLSSVLEKLGWTIEGLKKVTFKHHQEL